MPINLIVTGTGYTRIWVFGYIESEGFKQSENIFGLRLFGIFYHCPAINLENLDKKLFWVPVPSLS